MYGNIDLRSWQWGPVSVCPRRSRGRGIYHMCSICKRRGRFQAAARLLCCRWSLWTLWVGRGVLGILAAVRDVSVPELRAEVIIAVSLLLLVFDVAICKVPFAATADAGCSTGCSTLRGFVLRCCCCSNHMDGYLCRLFAVATLPTANCACRSQFVYRD